MGRPSRAGTAAPHIVSFRLTEDELEIAQRIAAKRGLSVSELAREALSELGVRRARPRPAAAPRSRAPARAHAHTKPKPVAAPPSSRTHPTKDRAASRPTPSLAQFAAVVLRIARGVEGWMGGQKKFISHVWDAGFQDMPLDTFKRRLVEAHRAGALSLSRADLVEAMDARDVAASETKWFGAEFHFIRL